LGGAAAYIGCVSWKCHCPVGGGSVAPLVPSTSPSPAGVHVAVMRRGGPTIFFFASGCTVLSLISAVLAMN